MATSSRSLRHRYRKHQVKATCYAKGYQQKLPHQTIMKIIMTEITKNSLKDLSKKLLTDKINKKITKDCSKIFPLYNVFIRKIRFPIIPKLI
jgi:small subunit ribosomal protein S3Ae